MTKRRTGAPRARDLIPEWGEVLQDARRDYNRRHRVDLTLREIGEMMAPLVPGREKPFPRQQVMLWFQGARAEMRHFLALVAVLEIDAQKVPELMKLLATPAPEREREVAPGRRAKMIDAKVTKVQRKRRGEQAG